MWNANLKTAWRNITNQKIFSAINIFGLTIGMAARFVMNKWPQDFSYRVNITAGVFIVAALIALFIAFPTVSLKAIKAAVANPVKSLRSE